MLGSILLRLNSVKWRRVLGLGAACTIIVMAFYVRLQRIALKQAELAYTHPRTVQRVRIIRRQGPVRIVTRTIRTEGREEIFTEETRAPILEVSESAKISEPVFQASRPSRWILGAGLESFRYRESRSWTAYGGYSIGGRLDLCAGISGRGQGRALVMWRF